MLGEKGGCCLLQCCTYLLCLRASHPSGLSPGRPALSRDPHTACTVQEHLETAWVWKAPPCLSWGSPRAVPSEPVPFSSPKQRRTGSLQLEAAPWSAALLPPEHPGRKPHQRGCRSLCHSICIQSLSEHRIKNFSSRGDCGTLCCYFPCFCSLFKLWVCP